MLDYANNKRNILGQFFTSDNNVDFCLSKIEVLENVIEPSYGSGSFLKKLPLNTIGIEIDADLFADYSTKNCHNLNFYDYNETLKDRTTIIGNPPYRTPAYSLSTHKDYIKNLCKKYKVKGIKEEAIFFIIKTYDLFKQSNATGNIGYIVPKSIFTNTSNAYKSFKNFCISNMKLVSIDDIESDFKNVSQDLVFAYFEVNNTKDNNDMFLLNGIKTLISDYWCQENDIIKHTAIFKKTYLGSVPAESFLFSCKKENKTSFMNRLLLIFKSDLDEDNLISYLSYNGEPHLRALRNKNKNKIQKVLKWVKRWKELVNEKEVTCPDNYKEIIHRKEKRIYFKLKKLEKQKDFVYILNKNNEYSFYFPGNPTRTSTDYFGYCDYDVNRNSCPGAIRTVPVKGIEANISDEFKNYWMQNTDKDIKFIFDYLLFVSKSEWYKDYKNKNQRFYFCIPKKFMKSFNT